jgi:tripartite-type tricarboxylate transporter receptor subunit TctC
MIVFTRSARASRLTRRAALAAAAAVAALAFAGLLPAPAAAQDAPAIRLVVPFGPGTTTDIVGRLVGDAMGRTLKQTVVVDNRAGAGGSTGTDAVAKAPADGRTLVMGTVGTHGINASLFAKLPYDPMRDFAPIGFVGQTPTLLVVGTQGKVATLQDLKALAARPEGATFASAGNGTSGHLAGELLAQRLGGKMIHVPFKEGAAAVTAVIAGQVDFMFYHPAGVLPNLRAGKLRALGASSAARSIAAPDVPSLQEQGVADFDLVPWFLLYAPAATPPAQLETLRAAFAATIAQPELQAKLKEQGIEPRTPPIVRADALAGFNRAEIAKWAELVKRSGARVD